MTTQHITTRHGSEPGRPPVLMEGSSLAAPRKPCSRCSPLPRLALTCQHPVNVCFLNPVRTSPPLVQPVSSTPNPLVIGAFRHARQAPRSGMRVLRLRGTRERLSDSRGAAPIVGKCFSAGGLLTTTQVVGNKASVSVEQQSHTGPRRVPQRSRLPYMATPATKSSSTHGHPHSEVVFHASQPAVRGVLTKTRCPHPPSP